jgi:hypothetical protein
MERPSTQVASISIFCLILSAILVFHGWRLAYAQEAELTSLSGDVQVFLKEANDYAPAQEGMSLEAGDKIKTGANSFAELSFNDVNTNIVRMENDTSMEIKFSGDEKLEMAEGEVFSSVGSLPSGSAFEIRTPTAVSGARGTDWTTKVTAEGTDVEAVEDVPYVRHLETDGTFSRQATLINSGQMTTVRKFQKPAPLRPMDVNRRQHLVGLKQDVRKRSGEAIIRRQERPRFNRQEFMNKPRGQNGPSLIGEQGLRPPPGRQEQKRNELSQQGAIKQNQNHPRQQFINRDGMGPANKEFSPQSQKGAGPGPRKQPLKKKLPPREGKGGDQDILGQ